MIDALGLALLVLATLPAGLTLVNLRHFRPPAPTRRPRQEASLVSVLIPARNEEATIASALEAILDSRGVSLELRVMDDGSDDSTASIVRSIARRDSRVHLHPSAPLADGWCGKQHACHQLAKMAQGEILVFVDADVTLSPDALERIVRFLIDSKADLVSGFPRQLTGTFLERLLLPLIHFVLLGFLPISRMRASTSPSLAAGCGQLMVVRRDAYRLAGGHAAIRASRHDGIQLPRVFRRAGLETDLFDATDIARCRMYRGARQVWNGLAKNATEGMAAPAAILPWTLLLGGGQVLPAALLATSAAGLTAPELAVWSAGALALGMLDRALLAWRFHQSWLGVLLHPLSVLLLLAIQWYALLRDSLGRPVAWKGRHA